MVKEVASQQVLWWEYLVGETRKDFAPHYTD
jgi:hypothetical protein